MPFVQKQLADVLTVARASAGTVFDAAGNLTTVAANLPRFDYDPITKAFRGLLVEEQRTNTLRNSQGGGAVAGVLGSGGAVPTFWAMSSSSGVAREIVGIGVENGIPYIDVRFTGTPTVAAWWLGFESSWPVAAPGQVFTTSAFVRRLAGAGIGVAVLVEGVTAANAWVENSGYVVPPALLDGGRLVRASITRTMQGATVERARAQIEFTATVGQSVDSTIRIGLPQLEQGAFPTSPIITTNAAATRAADVVQVIDGLWRGNSAHTLYVEASRFVIQPAGTGGAIFAALRTADVAVDGVFIACSASVPTTQGVQIWGRAVNILNPAAATAGTVYKLAVTTSKTRCAAAIDGAFIGAATFAELPALTRLFLGSHGSTASFLNGHIRNVQYTDRVISDADLIAVSQKGLAA